MLILRKDCISGRARPVPHHQDRHLFPREPAFGGSPAPFLGPSREPVSLPFLGSQEKSLVGFCDAAFLPGPEAGAQGQESVSPQKGRFRVDSALPGRLPNRLPFAKFFQEEHPAVLVMKTRKRRVRQRIEGALASPAPEARESGRVPPWSDLRVVAMRINGGFPTRETTSATGLSCPATRQKPSDRVSAPMSWIQQLEDIFEM